MDPEVKDPEVFKGNTTSLNTSFIRARSLQLTLNQIDFYNEIKNFLTNLKSFKYLISCKETAPTTGHEHIHIYVNFNNCIKLSLKNFKGAHIEKCKGTPKQNINYIKKDGNILDEEGEEPHQGQQKIKDALKTDPEVLKENYNIQYYNIINKIIKEQTYILNEDNNFKDISIYYFYGNDRQKLFKTALSFINGEQYTEFFYDNKIFYGNYHINSKYCILKDFKDNEMNINVFKDFIDNYKHYIRIQYETVLNHFTTIIILSTQPYYSIYNKEIRNYIINLDKFYPHNIDLFNLY